MPYTFPELSPMNFRDWKDFSAATESCIRMNFYDKICTPIDKSHSIFVLQKGDKRKFDSRYPGVLRADVEIIKSPDRVSVNDLYEA